MTMDLPESYNDKVPLPVAHFPHAKEVDTGERLFWKGSVYTIEVPPEHSDQVIEYYANELKQKGWEVEAYNYLDANKDGIKITINRTDDADVKLDRFMIMMCLAEDLKRYDEKMSARLAELQNQSGDMDLDQQDNSELDSLISRYEAFEVSENSQEDFERSDLDSIFIDGYKIGSEVDESGQAGGKFRSVSEPIEMEFQLRQVGDIHLPTGQLLACDPGFIGAMKFSPIERTVSPGKYLVTISIDDSGTIAASKIEFKSSKVAKWERARLLDKQHSEFAHIDVDSGTACFIDFSIAEDITQEGLDFINVVLSDDCYYDIIDLPGSDGGNFAIFHAGLGDGSYPCWWGLDEDDQAVCFVADYMITESEESIILVFDNIKQHLESYLEHSYLTKIGGRIRVTPGIEENTFHIESNRYLQPAICKNDKRIKSDYKELSRPDEFYSCLLSIDEPLTDELTLELFVL